MALGVFVAAFGIGQLLLGPLSDRLGRRPVLICGLLLFLVGTAGILVVETVPGLAAVRAVQGLGACAAFALARAIVRDVWGKDAAPALALTMFGMLLTVMLAPLVGGIVASAFAAWTAAIVLTLGLGVLTLLAVLFIYHETNVSPDPRAGRIFTLVGSYADLLSGRAYSSFALALGCTYGAMFAFIAGSSFVFVGRLGLTPTECGAVFGLIVSGLIVGTLATKRLAPKIGPDRLVAIGTAMVAAGALATLILHRVPGFALLGLVAPQMILTLGAGLVLPSAIAGAVLPNPQRAGLAAGFMGFSQMVGATIAGFLLARLQDETAMPMLLIQTAFAALAFTLFRLVRPKQGATPAEPKTVRATDT